VTLNKRSIRKPEKKALRSVRKQAPDNLLYCTITKQICPPLLITKKQKEIKQTYVPI